MDEKIGSEMVMQDNYGQPNQTSKHAPINTHDVITIDEAVIASVEDSDDHVPFGHSINSNDQILNTCKVAKNIEFQEIKEEPEQDHESSMNLILSRMLNDRKKNGGKGKFKIKKKDIKMSNNLDVSNNSSIRSPFGSKTRIDAKSDIKGKSK